MQSTLAIAALATTAQAGLTQMSQDVNALKANLTSVMGRSVTQILDEAMDRFNQWGCWCYFDDDHTKGRGQPVNELDHKCKQLSHGYACAMIDYEQTHGEDSCIPWEVAYVSGVGGLMGNNLDDLIATCNRANGNDCEKYACMVEGAFIIDAVRLIVKGTEIDSSFHSNNGFTPRESCPVAASNEERAAENSCCGSYPYRFTYRPRVDGLRQCCGQRVVNTDHFDCCSDETPAPIGTCENI